MHLAEPKKYRVLLLARDEVYPAYISEGFRAAGHEVKALRCIYPFDELQLQIKSFNPDFVLARNFGVFAFQGSSVEQYTRFFRENSIPCFIWYQDHPEGMGGLNLMQVWASEGAPKNTLFGVIDETHLEFLKERGAKGIYLPMAAPEFLFHRIPIETEPPSSWEYSFTYAGSLPYFPQGLSLKDSSEVVQRYYRELAFNDFVEKIDPGIEDPSHLKIWHDQVRSIIEAMFRTWVETPSDFKTLRTKVFELFSPLFHPDDFHLAKLCLAEVFLIYHVYQSYEIVRVLARDMNLRVFGDGRWKSSWIDYPQSTNKLSFDELYKLYENSAINFGQTKWQFQKGVHERPFVMLASNGLPLTDFREHLQDCFSEGELAIYEKISELPSKVKYLLDHPELIREMIQKGRRKVFDQHRYSHRAAAIVSAMQDEFGL